MKNDIILSIIIPSFKRVELLKFGLESLSKQIIDVPYEILVLNDGIEDETQSVCDKYKDKLNIRYLFTGQRNSPKLIWRVPGFAINIAIKQCHGKIILLTAPEIYYTQNNIVDSLTKEVLDNHKALAITNGYSDTGSYLLDYLRKGGTWKSFIDYLLLTNFFTSFPSINKHTRVFDKLDTKYPFCMAMYKEEIIKIGGYDEDFIGYCYDDADLIDRLLGNGCFHKKLNSLEIVHLYHTRQNREGLSNRNEQLRLNDKLYKQKKGVIIRNVGKVWGKLNINPNREERFTKHYNDNLFRGCQSKSGRGSDRDITSILEIELIKFLSKIKIKTLIDAPCGDFNWMQHVLPKVKVNYIGIDIVKELIDNNNKLYSTNGINFIQGDLIDFPLPKGDLMLCRDCLPHLPYKDIFKLLNNFVNSNIKYLLTTTFLYENRTNVNFEGEINWFPICLMKEPFNFPYPILLIDEECKEVNGEYNDKSLGLWNRETIQEVLKKYYEKVVS